MKETIAQETRKHFCYLKHEIQKGNEKILVYLSGTMQKRTKMYKEIYRYESDAKIDFELGIISKEEYEIEMKAIKLLEQSVANFKVF